MPNHNPPNYVIRNCIIAMNNPVMDVYDLSRVGNLNGVVFLDYAVHSSPIISKLRSTARLVRKSAW